MNEPAGKRRCARCSKNISSGTRPGTATTCQPVCLMQHVAQAAEVRNAVGGDGQVAHAGDELVARAAGQEPRLPLEERLPHAVLDGGVPVPALIDGPVLRVRSAGFARGGAVSSRFRSAGVASWRPYVSRTARRRDRARAVAEADAAESLRARSGRAGSRCRRPRGSCASRRWRAAAAACRRRRARAASRPGPDRGPDCVPEPKRSPACRLQPLTV